MKRSTKSFAKKASNLYQSVHQRLNMFAGATVVAVLSVLALARPSEAKIVYTPVRVVIFNRTYNLDLNKDGMADFSISASDAIGSCKGQVNLTDSLKVVPTQGNGVLGSGGLAAVLRAGAPIGPTVMYPGTELTMAYLKLGWFSAGSWGCYLEHLERGNWLNVTNRYLGLKFMIKGKAHYGWAKLTVQIRLGLRTTLTGYAYETIAGKSIMAGKTHGPADDSTLNPDSTNPDDFGPSASVTNPISETPQPATLGMLGLGAQGVPLWRRKESAACTSGNN
jgi:hypothetical protein